MTNAPEYRLGKAPVKVDPRTIRLESILSSTLPPPPVSVDNSVKWSNLGILGNDKYGCCVMAGWANLLDLIANYYGGTFTCTSQEVVAQYLALTGGKDTGLVELDFLKWAMKNAWKGQEVLAFASVASHDMTLMAQAISIAGAVFRGVELPTTAQAQVGKLWDFLPGVAGNQPGSWGGHCTIGVGYDQGTQRTKDLTWAIVQPATYAFWQAYQSESYAIITSETPGINRDALEAQLEQIGQYVGPTPNPPAPPPVPVVTIMVDGIGFHFSDGADIQIGSADLKRKLLLP